MAEAAAWGLPPGEALAGLLRLRGVEPRPEDPGLDGSLEGLVAPLARHGLQARPVRLGPGGAAFLILPTLALHRDGSFVLLRRRTWRGFEVLGAQGPRVVDARALEALLGDQALDLAQALPEGRPLWEALGALMASHGTALAQVVAGSVLLQLLGLLSPALAGLVLNRALPDGARSTLALVAAGTVLLAAVHAWIRYVRGRALLHVASRMGLAAERGFLEHILALPFSQLRGRPLGEWLQGFGGFQAAREILAEKTLGVLLDGALAGVLLAALLWLLPGAAAVVAATALVTAGAAILAGRVEARFQAQEVDVQVKAQGYLSELLLGIATLKAAGTERPCLARWRRLYRQGLLLAQRRARAGLWASTGMGALGRTADAGILVWGGLRVVRGELSLGAFLAFQQMASAFLGAVLGLAETYVKLRVLRPRLAKAAAILELAREPARPLQDAAPAPLPLALEGVAFRYRTEGPWVLQDFNLRLEAGEKRRVERPSGWGKSTLLRLLAGLERPERGQVLIGGLPPAENRHTFLYQPQTVRLHAGSILENLRLLSGGAPAEALLEAAAATGLAAWLETLPMGLRTLLPAGGGTLSGGQRQWVALTAALGSGRGVLILDEPTANMDPPLAARLGALLDSGPWTVLVVGHGARIRP